MAIVEHIKENGDKIYKYQQPGDELLYEQLAVLIDVLEIYVNKQSELQFEDILIDTPVLAELLVRIDKRKDYFVVFHDDTEINEIKEAALLAYWLIKFKPLRIKSDDIVLHRKYSQINEAFAVFLLYSAIKEETQRTANMSFTISKEYNQKIMYAFKYWDISKESLMLIAESLCEAMYSRKEQDV